MAEPAPVESVKASPDEPPPLEVEAPPRARRRSRRGVLGRLRALHGWDAGAVFGSIAFAGIYYFYSTLCRYEPSDPVTPFMIAAIVVAVILFREQIDRLLVPLQGIRRKVPKIFLVGIGLGVPFVLAHILFIGTGLRQYTFMRVCLVLGGVISYIIVRTPSKEAIRIAQGREA